MGRSKGFSHSEDTKKKISISKKGKKSGATGKNWKLSIKDNTRKSKLWIGKNNPNWKGGVTEKSNKERHSLEVKLWKVAVFTRDNWTCQMCGHRNEKGSRKNINAHHIKPFAKYKELRTSISNGTTLCEKCHKIIHKN